MRRRPAGLPRAALTGLVAALSVVVALVGLPGEVSAAARAPIPTSVQPVLNGDLTSYQWMLDAVHAPQAWRRSTGEGVTVAVLDSGVDSTRPDLAGQVVAGGVLTWTRTGFTVRDAPLSTTDQDGVGHGTHVAGIIAANDDGQGITGIAPDARILPVMWPDHMLEYLGLAQFFNSIAAAVTYASARGVNVINISVGGSLEDVAQTKVTDRVFRAQARACEAIHSAQQHGAFVSVAAGNDGMMLNGRSIPAACEGAFSVSAVGPDLRRAPYSSYDSTVQLAAPGTQVLSVASSFAREFRGGHVEATGTSMAAPVVAGVAALVQSQHSSWGATSVAQALTSSAHDLAPTGRDPETGFGLVDAAAAVGASAPAARPLDHVSALAYEQLWFGATTPVRRPSVVAWSPPAVHAVTGYTVTVFDESGSWSRDVDGLQVRLLLRLRPESWVQVVAHTSAGDVTSFPTWLISNSSGTGHPQQPPKVRHVTVERTHHAIVVRWRPPRRDVTRIDRIEVYAPFRSAHALLRRTVRVPDGGPFPTVVRLRTPHRLLGHDCDRVEVVSVHRTKGWGPVYNAVTRRGPFAAVHGLAIERLTPAGRDAVEVAGSIAPSAARRTCGNASCAGRQVAVTVRVGSSTATASTRLTSHGQFHAIVWRPAGARRLVLQGVGPGSLTSGPFWRYRVR